jgi:4-alpha-glucanotransferase
MRTVDNPVFQCRRAGVLLHLTSLPTTPGNGDLGAQAYYFIDFLVSAGMSVWQMLPIGIPNSDLSPYQCQSVYAGNPLLISLDKLVEKGWLSPDPHPPLAPEAEVNNYRYARLQQAWHGFQRIATDQDHAELAAFIKSQKTWLEDFALFRALKQQFHNAVWTTWEPAYRDRDRATLLQARKELDSDIQRYYFEQFVFFDQWQQLRHYAHQKGVFLFGDVPIFVAGDSVEVWAQRDIFLLDAEGNPTVVAGVPPDYFSDTGQLWGNPLYNWKTMQRRGFKWWVDRLTATLKLFDVVRIDHFRGFEAYWEVAAIEATAMNGKWVKAPGRALFNKLQKLGSLPLVAEDLGVITTEVEQLRDNFGLPGMKILQFAFDNNPQNPYLPHNHVPNSIVYTGTHDNDTTLGWYQTLSDEERQYLRTYLGSHGSNMPYPLIRAAFASVAMLAIIPMQDILGLDGEHRMNVPGTKSGNWRWRFQWEQLPPNIHERLLQWMKLYGRDTIYC